MNSPVIGTPTVVDSPANKFKSVPKWIRCAKARSYRKSFQNTISQCKSGSRGKFPWLVGVDLANCNLGAARSTPTNQGNFPLLGLLNCEMVFWNDLRYERALAQRVHFGTLLNMFAGESTTVGVPMTGEHNETN